MRTILYYGRRCNRALLIQLCALLTISLAAGVVCFSFVGQLQVVEPSGFVIGGMGLGVTAVFCTILRAYLLLVNLATQPRHAPPRLPSATAKRAVARTGLSST